MKKRRVPFNDADYLSRLSADEKDWYKRFVAQHYFGFVPKEKPVLDKEQQRKAWNEQNAQRRCAHWRAVKADTFKITFDPSDALIEYYDAAHPQDLPLVREGRLVSLFLLMTRGSEMTQEEKDKAEAARLLAVAIECVGDAKFPSKSPEAKDAIQCLNLLLRWRDEMLAPSPNAVA